MKKLLLFLSTIFILGISIYYCVHDIYIGNVVGPIKVSERYIPQNRTYECVDISFTYKTPKGEIHDVKLTEKDPYYLQNTERGRHLSKDGKYYNIPWWLALCIGFGAMGSLVMFIILIVNWVCYSDTYNFNTPKEDFGCRYCGMREFCYFENSKIHISETSKLILKQFFGY